MWYDGNFPWNKGGSGFPDKCGPDKCIPDKCKPDKCFPDNCFPDKCFPDKCFPDKQSLLKIIKCLCILKKEFDKCKALLCNPKFGLKEIKKEIRDIEINVETLIEVILSPTFGLREIKAEVAGIEDAVFSPTFGLQEIKTEVAGIEDAVFSPTFGLQEIKSEVAGIEDAIFSPTFGLQEIKTEIIEILANQGVTPFLSTGPFFVDCLEQTLHLKVLNYTTTAQSVNFVIHNLANCPITVGAVTVPIPNIPACCAASVEVPLPGEGERNLEIRAELSTATLGLLVYAATKTGLPNCQGTKVNEFKHSEWAPLTTFCG